MFLGYFFHNYMQYSRVASGKQVLISTSIRTITPVQTGPGAHPASCTMGTGSFPRVKSGRGVTLIPHPLLVSWSRKGIPLLPLRAVRPVQSLRACTKVNFTFFYKNNEVIASLSGDFRAHWVLEDHTIRRMTDEKFWFYTNLEKYCKIRNGAWPRARKT